MVIIASILATVAIFTLPANPLNFLQESILIDETKAFNEEALREKIDNIEAENLLPVNEVVEAASPVENVEEEMMRLQFVAVPPPEITAQSAFLIDANSKQVLFAKNPDVSSPIASITKLMTALVILDQSLDYSREYTLVSSDRREGGRIYLFNGDTVTINDLLNVSLVGSANTATMALVRAAGFSEDEFVKKMNAKAAELNLSRTTFADPIGLSTNNISTARDVSRLLSEALSHDKIQQILVKPSYVLKTKQGKYRTIYNTDDLISKNTAYRVLGGKTGFLGEAGFCFTGKFSDLSGNEIIAVVLGSAGVNLRFLETEQLVRWAYTNYLW